MNIVFLVHPAFFSQSMPRFSKMLADGMLERGHTVEVWAPVRRLSSVQLPEFYKKWLSYVDLYVLFPADIRRQLKNCPPDTLFVVTDNALGPWVPLISNRPHVIHCHDFLAQRSALNEIPENRLSWTGKQYQAFIRRGYSQGANFISVSEKTRHDLHSLLPAQPTYSDVVYNGLNQTFTSYRADEARISFGEEVGIRLEDGYLLHIGGNQWYKNRTGVIEIYNALRSTSTYTLPLVLIGAKPSEHLLHKRAASPFAENIHFLTGIADSTVQVAYAGASAFLFPSLAEGFGWPIAEAMAAGCPVVTTAEAPMTEVAGNAGFLIPRQPSNKEDMASWAEQAATVLQSILDFSPAQRNAAIQAGYANARRFNTNSYLNEVETVYKHILLNKYGYGRKIPARN